MDIVDMYSSLNIQDLPGGNSFYDVTSVFVEGADAMLPDTVLLMDEAQGLHMAMSAIEIGEPRLDTGYIRDVEKVNDSPWDPLTPLLPEEICWIMDRSLTCEVQWHLGNALQHTVFIFLYVHCFMDIDHDTVPHTPSVPDRPIELITVVLQAWTESLLKCCALSWIELDRRHLQSDEDWHGDKCEVYMAEAKQVDQVLSSLENSILWLSTTDKVSERWKTALLSRLEFRKTLLQIISSTKQLVPSTVATLSSDRAQFKALVDSSQEHLNSVQRSPSVEPAEESPARRVFDPYIARRLEYCVPIHILTLPHFDETCQSLALLLDGLQELITLSQAGDLTAWENAGNLATWLPHRQLQLPYIRSLTISTFSSSYSPRWLLDQFFQTNFNLSFSTAITTIKSRWLGDIPFNEMESPFRNSLEQILYSYVKSQWLNPPRRRRSFMKSALQWHILYDLAIRMLEETNIVGRNAENDRTVRCVNELPTVVLAYRMSVVLEILLSGFQLELYGAEERSFVYWYVWRITETHLWCLERIVEIAERDSPLHKECLFQQCFLTALQAMAIGIFSTIMHTPAVDWTRACQSFYKRYKWALSEDYDNIETEAVAQPDWHLFELAMEYLNKDIWFSPADSFVHARTILMELLNSGNLGRCMVEWQEDRVRLLQSLISVCDNLSQLPSSTVDHAGIRNMKLKWDVQRHPWFPYLSLE